MEPKEKKAHSPLPWRVGRVLMTETTRRLSPERIAEHEAREKCLVFAHFNHDDAGRGRLLVADCRNGGLTPNADENAALIVRAVNNHEEAVALLEHLADWENRAQSLKDYADLARALLAKIKP